MALEYVLHARYHAGTTVRGSATYGAGRATPGQGGSPCGSQLEAPYTGETIDVSRQRSVFDYFSTRPNVYLPGSAGIFPAGSGDAEVANFHKQAINRVANFHNDIYYLVGDKVYKWDDDAQQFDVSLVMTGKGTTNSESIGLYPVNAGGRSKLITAWSDGGGGNWRVGSLDGATNEWTVSSVINLGNINDGDGAVHTEHQHNNRIYFIAGGTPTIIWYFDFESFAFGSITWPGPVRFPMDFCTYFNELYCINKDNAENVLIWKIPEDGSPPEFITTYARTPSDHVGEDFFSALTISSDFEGRPILYVDNSTDDRAVEKPKLISYYVISGFSEKFGTIDDTAHGFGSIVYQLPDGAPAVTGLQSFQSLGFDDNPLKMMTNQLGAGEEVQAAKGEGMVVRLHVNQHEKYRGDGEFSAGKTAISCSSRYGMFCSTPTPGDGGGDGNVLFQHIAAPSGAFNFFAFQKEGRHRAFPHEKIGGGARISVVDSNGSKIIGLTVLGVEPSASVDGAMRINYELHTTTAHPNGTLVNTRFFYDPHGHAPETPCRLVNTDVGSISGNIVFNIVADSGVVHYVDWDARGANLPSGRSKVNLNGLAAATGVDGGSGIPPLTSPQDIPGLALWLDAADVLTISSGTGVSSWGDKSGAGIVGAIAQATTSRQPEYLWGEQNGLNGVLFDGSDDYLFATPSPVLTHSMTFMLVYKPKVSISGPAYLLMEQIPLLNHNKRQDSLLEPLPERQIIIVSLLIRPISYAGMRLNLKRLLALTMQ